MIKNNMAWRWGIILFAIVTPALVAWYIHLQRDYFSCDGHLTIVQDNGRIDTSMSYVFANGKGNYHSSGLFIPQGQRPVPISNRITFNYWRAAGRVIMVSRDTNELPKKDESFRHMIPDFYHQRNHGISIRVNPANASAAIFIYGNTPIFYCSVR